MRNRIIQTTTMPTASQVRGMAKDSTTLDLDVIRFSVLELRYSKVREEFATTGATEGDLLKALRIGHRIHIADTLRTDPLLYFIISTQQMQMFRDEGEADPSVLMILGTAQVIDLDRQNAIDRFKALKKED